ncbi:hypothetical protein [Nocardia vaccinii]|uniref:hypothetical protein n=1 Tax=Nocardia vaccinii TaxID=1822 RepID=UPI000833EFAC|nr:hypothetical protein [Nocardia vaccinii]
MTEPGTPPRYLTDPLGTIADLVRHIEPDLDGEQITAAILATASTRARLRKLAQALNDDPGLLTSTRPQGPRTIEQLIRALQDCGARHVELPRCARCARPRPLVSLDAKRQRICGSCFSSESTRVEVCSGCGKRLEVQTRDRAGAARCRNCPPEPDCDHLSVIVAHIRRVAGDHDSARLRQIAEQAVPQPFQRREVSWELDAHPELLTGDAASGSPRLIALVEQLVLALVPGVVAPRCPLCDREVALKFRRDGRRCCRRCYDAARLETCCRCGESRAVATRTSAGDPLCTACMRRDPAGHEHCTNCGQTRLIVHRDGDQRYCRQCRRAPTAVCSICGKTKPCHLAHTANSRCESCSRKLFGQACINCGRVRAVHRRTPEGPLCHTCGQRRAPCSRCGRTMRVQASLAVGPLCPTCFRNEPAYFQQCIECGVVEHLYHHGKCQHCACPPLLRAVLVGPDGVVRPDLEPMIGILLASPPRTVLSWINSPGSRAVMTALAAASGPVTHELLDTLTPEREVFRLRQILVAAEHLPARDEYLRRLEQWLDTTLTTISDSVERNLVRRYVTWNHLRKLRQSGPITNRQQTTVRSDVSNIISLLNWLRDNDRTLAICRQVDIDDWLNDGPEARCTIRKFLTWCAHRRAARKLTIPAHIRPELRTVFTETHHRWALARRLLHSDSIDDRDRVAGLLVLLYAQQLTRVVALTTNDVIADDHGVQLKLGSKPLQLHPPMSELLLRLVENRRGHAALGHTDDHPWLFPGGIPGRHLTASQQMQRLQQLGIPARIGRNTALMDLATELPSAVISDLLGLSIHTADHWTTAAGNTHHGYAAQLVQRQP